MWFEVKGWMRRWRLREFILRLRSGGEGLEGVV